MTYHSKTAYDKIFRPYFGQSYAKCHNRNIAIVGTLRDILKCTSHNPYVLARWFMHFYLELGSSLLELNFINNHSRQPTAF